MAHTHTDIYLWGEPLLGAENAKGKKFGKVRSFCEGTTYFCRMQNKAAMWNSLSLLVSDSDTETFTQGTGKWMHNQHPYALCVQYCL